MYVCACTRVCVCVCVCAHHVSTRVCARTGQEWDGVPLRALRACGLEERWRGGGTVIKRRQPGCTEATGALVLPSHPPGAPGRPRDSFQEIFCLLW